MSTTSQYVSLPYTGKEGKGSWAKHTFSQEDPLALGLPRDDKGAVLRVHGAVARGHAGVEAGQQGGEDDGRAGDVVEDRVHHGVHAGSDIGDVEVLGAVVGSGVDENDVREEVQGLLEDVRARNLGNDVAGNGFDALVRR